MAKDTETRVAAGSLLPEDFEGGGLADDFVGTIRNPTFLPWDYNGTRDEYSFASKWLIEPDEEVEGAVTNEGMVEVFYSAGDLKAFVPSPDGVEPAGDLEVYAQLAAGEVELDPDEIGDYSGPFYVPIGKRKSISPSCRLARAITDARKAGFPDDRLIESEGDIRCFDGARGRFNRLPDQERSGIRGGRAQESGRSNDILVMTEFLGFEEERSAKSKAKGGKAKAASKKATGKSKASKAKAAEVEEEEEAEEEEGDLTERAQEAALTVLADAEDTTLPSAKLAVAVAKEFGKKEKGAVMKLVRDSDFLENGPWEYDEEEDTVSL